MKGKLNRVYGDLHTPMIGGETENRREYAADSIFSPIFSPKKPESKHVSRLVVEEKDEENELENKKEKNMVLHPEIVAARNELIDIIEEYYEQDIRKLKKSRNYSRLSVFDYPKMARSAVNVIDKNFIEKWYDLNSYKKKKI